MDSSKASYALDDYIWEVKGSYTRDHPGLIETYYDAVPASEHIPSIGSGRLWLWSFDVTEDTYGEYSWIEYFFQYGSNPTPITVAGGYERGDEDMRNQLESIINTFGFNNSE
jgi:hypothetical protein